MKPPIVIVENNDISVHPSAKHAGDFLEPWDVRDGVYTAYDSEGYLPDLNIQPITVEHHFLWFRWVESYEIVVVTEHKPMVNHSGELCRRLTNYLNADSKSKLQNKSNDELPTKPLEQLIQAVGKYMPWHL